MSVTNKIIPQTKDSPEIILNREGMIKVSGRSMKGERTRSFLLMEEWLDKYISDPADVTDVEIHLEYFNKSNIKNFIALLKKFDSVRLMNKKCNINWHYEDGDDDILEQGEYISSFLETPVNFLKSDDESPFSDGDPLRQQTSSTE